jgi:hypothetical protein
MVLLTMASLSGYPTKSSIFNAQRQVPKSFLSSAHDEQTSRWMIPNEFTTGVASVDPGQGGE